jgi:hypothetical protein
MPGRIVVALPLYMQLPVEWFHRWDELEKDCVVGTVMTKGIYLPDAMDRLVDAAFYKYGNEWDRLVVYEHDMIPPVNGLSRMANYDPTEHHIVGSTYFKHDYPHHVMAWMQIQEPLYSPLTAEAVKEMVEGEHMLHPVHGVAMGFTCIMRSVFELWDRSAASIWHPAPPFVGHDLHFCNEARKQGFNIFLDAGIGCGHLTLQSIGYPHSQAALAMDAPPTWAAEFEREGVTDPNMLRAYREDDRVQPS